MQGMKMMKRVKRTYMQNIPKSTHGDSTSTDSVQSIVEIRKCCRTPIESGYLT